MPLQKPWQAWHAGREHERALPANLGVYEIADADGELVYIGFAGGKSLFGLRGELKKHFEGGANTVTSARGRQFRYEINQLYMSRYRDLLQRFREDNDRLPPGNEQVVPLERELDPDATELPREEFQRLRELTRAMGFYNPDVPVEFGGAGVDTTTRTMMAEEVSQHRAGLCTPCYHTFGEAALAQLYFGTEEQKQKYLFPALRGEKKGFFGLSEPSGGADPARAIRTAAVRDGDEWVINGSKLWISGADTADYGLLFVRTDSSTGRNGITCFIVDTDTPGFEVRRIVHVLRSTHPPTELSFDNMRVPHRNILGEEGGGFAIANDRLTRNRIPYTAECIGVAVAAQRMAVAWSKERVTFGEPLASRQAIQLMLVDNEIDITTSRRLALAAAGKADQGKPFRTEAAMCKLVGTEAAGRVVDKCIQIHGGLGVSKDLPLERWYRELRIRRIGEGPSEVQRIIMARDLLHSSLR